VTTQTEIANRALQKIGAKRITAFGETTSKEGREVLALWDGLRKSELRKYPWNFAITRASLPALVTDPDWGFDQCFALPDGCLRILEVNGSRNTADYRRESLNDTDKTQVIVCDDTAPLEVRFIQDRDNVGVWDASFCEAFAAKLATELALVISDSPSRKQLGDAGYAQAIADARGADAIEEPPEDLLEDDWNLARL